MAHFILESRDPALSVARIIQKHHLLPLRRALPLWRRRNATTVARLNRLKYDAISKSHDNCKEDP
ncbi:MAG: hypothetical protein HY360_00365 [Verrucomicrobia bacterium]|nr:hypothetical protein [Verrucomicrobiota bacterium]